MLVKPYVNCDANVEIPAWMHAERLEYCEDIVTTNRRRHLSLALTMILGLFA